MITASFMDKKYGSKTFNCINFELLHLIGKRCSWKGKQNPSDFEMKVDPNGNTKIGS
jgi:hypothetical protein